MPIGSLSSGSIFWVLCPSRSAARRWKRSIATSASPRVATRRCCSRGCEHAVAASYEPAFPAIEHFLTSMGRRKFLKPLYEDLDANPKTRDLARRIYEKARPSYHPSAVSTIDAMLKWQ